MLSYRRLTDGSRWSAILSLVAISSWQSAPAREFSSTEALLQLSLDQLMNVEVFSAGKKPQPLQNIPSAVFVIHPEDIRRAGVTSLPELLRMVPGMIVAPINGHAWAISARGEASYFSNKLLVMVDGRSVYFREFSGVLWEQLNLPLEDIEKVEVIRGPGGTLWGANAVNGVVNIITKPAGKTQGNLLTFAAGNELKGKLLARRGGTLDNGARYRVYARGLNQETEDMPYPDGQAAGQTGFRLDHQPLSGIGELSLQGAYYQGRTDELDWSPKGKLQEKRYKGAYLQGEWRETPCPEREWLFKAYYDYTWNESAFVNGHTHTLDLDGQYRFMPWKRHELVLGLNWRRYWNVTHPASFGKMSPVHYQEELASLLIQDEIVLQPKRWFLTVGGKFEYSEVTNLEIQPNLRLLWTPDPWRSVWAGVSRAVRIPAWNELRGEYRLGFPEAMNPYTPIDTYLLAGNDPTLEPEILWAYELGWRERISQNLFIDVALFQHEVKNIIDVLNEEVVPEIHSDQILLNGSWQNAHDVNYHGLELALNWQQSEALDWQFAYTYLKPPGSEPLQNKAFSHQFSLRGNWKIDPEWQVNAWWYYHDGLKGSDWVSPVDNSLNLDINLNWRASKNLDFSLTAKRLLEDDTPQWHWEVINRLVQSPGRSVALQARWRF